MSTTAQAVNGGLVVKDGAAVTSDGTSRCCCGGCGTCAEISPPNATYETVCAWRYSEAVRTPAGVSSKGAVKYQLADPSEPQNTWFKKKWSCMSITWGFWDKVCLIKQKTDSTGWSLLPYNGTPSVTSSDPPDSSDWSVTCVVYGVTTRSGTCIDVPSISGSKWTVNSATINGTYTYHSGDTQGCVSGVVDFYNYNPPAPGYPYHTDCTTCAATCPASNITHVTDAYRTFGCGGFGMDSVHFACPTAIGGAYWFANDAPSFDFNDFATLTYTMPNRYTSSSASLAYGGYVDITLNFLA